MTYYNPLNIIVSTVLLLVSSLSVYSLWNEINGIEQLKVEQHKQAVIIPNNETDIVTENKRITPEISEYDEIVKRPLFNDDRLPFVYVPPEKTEPKARKKPAKKTEEQYRLNAVVITPKKKIAIIQTGRKKELLRVGIGESVDDWTLNEITNHAVQLKNGDEIKTLELEIKASAKKPPKSEKGKKSPAKNKNAKTEDDAMKDKRKSATRAKKQSVNKK